MTILWLWSQWVRLCSNICRVAAGETSNITLVLPHQNGTVVEQNYKATLFSMFVSLAFIVGVRLLAEPTWDIGHVPDEEHPLIQHLTLYYGVWSFRLVNQQAEA